MSATSVHRQNQQPGPGCVPVIDQISWKMVFNGTWHIVKLLKYVCVPTKFDHLPHSIRSNLKFVLAHRWIDKTTKWSWTFPHWIVVVLTLVIGLNVRTFSIHSETDEKLLAQVIPLNWITLRCVAWHGKANVNQYVWSVQELYEVIERILLAFCLIESEITP